MTDRIPTEEAERIASGLTARRSLMRSWALEDETAAALRSLAAERDRLVNEATSLRNEVADLKSNVDMKSEALASLAAERDALRVALGEALDTSAECPIHPPCGNCKFCRAFKVYAAALGENQP